MINRSNKILGLSSLIAFLIAIPAGLFIPEICNKITFIGTIYVNLLKLMIIPVLFSGIVSALSNSKLAITGLTIKTIITFVAMFALSFFVCSVFWIILKPGSGATFTEIPWDGEIKALSFSEFIVSLFPANIISSMSSNSMLPVIMFAFVMGIAIRECKLYKLTGIFSELSVAFNKMLSYVMYLTPVGVFSLLSNTVSDYGSKILGTAAIYISCAYSGCLLIAIFVMILPVWILCGIDPGTYIKRVYRIWIMTITTCSSAATLPYTIRVCNEEFNIPQNITSLVVPLGCTIHMCGGAVSFSLLALFNMQMIGSAPTVGLWFMMFFIALILNMGAPGIPGGGIVIGATYLSMLGLPISFIGFYAGIYRLLDMAYTTMNVCGDISANILIQKMFVKKTDSLQATEKQ